jgi:hypothetical protein
LPLGAQFLKERPLVNASRAIKFNVRREREESTFKCHSRIGISNQENLNKEECILYRVQTGQWAEEILIEPSDERKLIKADSN